MTERARYRLDQFEIGERLGAGGMAVVYSGRHLRTGLPVAIKVMTSKLSRVPTHRRAFLREVRSAARLSHGGIVRVFDVGEIPPQLERDSEGLLTSGSPFLVMEHVEGPTLDQVDGLSWPQLRRLVLELLDALAHAHALGVIHRDIKPSNILLDESGDWRTAKLTDFGIARTLDIDRPESAWDAERKIAGTPGYMAPERVLGRWRDQGPWTDLYSIGVLVWRGVTGKHLYSGTTHEVLVAQVREELPPFEPKIDVPQRLDQWLRGMLAKSPHERFRRAADAAVALLEACRSPVVLGGDAAAKGAVYDEPELATLTTVLERPPDDVYRRQTGLVTEWPRPRTPADWRTAPIGTVNYRRVLDAGLGLFGLRTIPIVDRDDERDMLWGTLREVLQEHALRVVSVRGPAGVGKTRLIEWIAGRGLEVGAVDLQRAIHSETGGQADGIAGMLWRLFRVDGLSDHDMAVRVREQVRELTQGRDAIAEYDAIALAQMVTNDDDDARLSVDFVSPTERFHAVYRLLRNLTQARAQLLWIEDAHLAIDAVRFVRFLVEQAASDLPLLVVLSSRTEGPHLSDSLREDLRAIEQHDAARTLTLGHLPEPAMRLLVRRTLGLSPDLTEDVVRRAEGTPMFAVQAVGDWVESHALVSGPHGYELADDRVAVPDDVHDLWQRRIQRIVGLFDDGDHALESLYLAALLGRWVDAAEWTECAQPDDDRLDRLLDELLRLGLAERRTDGWSFAHAMMRESLLRMANSDGRAHELNLRCARSLDRLHDLATPSIALRVANHLHSCTDDVAALDVLLGAIRGAKAAHDYDWLERLLAAADRVVASLGLDQSDQRRGLLDVTRARLLTVRNRLLDCRNACERLVAQAQQHGWLRVEGEAMFQLGSNELSLGHTDKAVQNFRRSHDLFAQLDEQHNLARAREGIGYAYLHQGRFTEAKPYVESAGELYREIGEPRGLSFNLYHRGIIARYEGDLDESRRLYEESQRLAGRLGFRDTLANATNALGDLERHAGNLERARECYRDAFDLWSAIGASGANVSSINLAITMVQAGDFDDAEALLMPLAEQLQRENAGMQLTFALAAMLPIHAGRRAEALYDLTLERFDACRASYDIHDPDLDLVRDMCVDAWSSYGDDARVAATIRGFGDDD